VLQELAPRVREALQPSIYFRTHAPEWPPKADPRVSIDKVVEFVKLRSALMRYELGMAWYDHDFTGYLTVEV
jgi:hypothetical protein